MHSSNAVGPPALPPRLDSWKQIAAYLNRGLSTVQRWEAEEGLPVHRLQHGKGGSVFAYPQELDAWRAKRGHALNAEAQEPLSPLPSRFALGAGLLAAIAGLGAATLLLGAWLAATPPAGHVSRHFTIVLPADAPLTPVSALPLGADKPALALSPDGRVLVYVALTGGHVRLVAYDLAAETLTPLPGTRDGHTPFFSPDGSRLGFFSDGKLWTMAVAGGPPTALADVSNPWGASWGADGVIFFNRLEAEGIVKIEPEGGKVQQVFPGAGSGMPQPLAPGHGILAFLGNQDPEVAWVRQGRTERLFKGFAARYVSSGHLLYASGGALMAVPFDLDRGAVTGAHVGLARDLRTAPYGVAQFAVSDEGTLVYAPGSSQAVADGRLLMPESADYAKPVTTLKVITNVLEELKRKAPRSF